MYLHTTQDYSIESAGRYRQNPHSNDGIKRVQWWDEAIKYTVYNAGTEAVSVVDINLGGE
jgi:hypothetical protein